MEKDKVESRTELVTCAWHGKQPYHEPKFYGDATCEKCATRPSVPEQGQALSKLLAITADVARRKYLPDIDDCRTIDAARQMAARFSDDHSKLANELKEVWAALAASRSEEATEQPVTRNEWLDILALIEKRRAKSSATPEGQAWNDALTCISDAIDEYFENRSGAPAAGNTERAALLKQFQDAFKTLSDDVFVKFHYIPRGSNAMKDAIAALAGTDTDVAKGE